MDWRANATGVMVALPASGTGPGNEGQNLPEAVLRALLAMPPGQQRAAECVKRRRLIQEDVMMLGKLLDEVSGSIGGDQNGAPPAADGRATGDASTHAASRLSWIYEQCQNLQGAATLLEAYDVGNPHESHAGHEASLEYAMMGVDIVAEQDRATLMLRLLERDVELQVADKPSQEPPSEQELSLGWEVLQGLLACGCGSSASKGSVLKPKRPAGNPKRRIFECADVELQVADKPSQEPPCEQELSLGWEVLQLVRL